MINFHPHLYPLPSETVSQSPKPRVVIPNEREGSRFLPMVEMTEGPTATTFPVCDTASQGRGYKSSSETRVNNSKINFLPSYPADSSANALSANISLISSLRPVRPTNSAYCAMVSSTTRLSLML